MSSAPPHSSPWNREHPYPARLLNQRSLTTAAAIKQVHHVEIGLGDSGLQYQCGDTLAIRIENDLLLVQEILQLCGLSGDAGMTQALLREYELTQVHAGFFKHFAGYCADPQLQLLAADSKLLRSYMEHKQIVDVLREFPSRLTAEQLRGCLRRLQDRQYSIASSPLVKPDSVELTVGLLQFSHDGHVREGAGSGFLSHRVDNATPLLVHVVSNANFRLPAASEVPVIMIGPGTGIAPFRGFLQQRQASGASGRNWLLTGFRSHDQDFLYGDELLAWQQNGLLARLDVAFSRDQASKVYVQHLLQQQAGAIYQWLQEGAHLYVCGDARHMAEDVQKTLLDIIGQQGRMDAAAARQYLVKLRQDQRYQRDVY